MGHLLVGLYYLSFILSSCMVNINMANEKLSYCYKPSCKQSLLLDSNKALDIITIESQLLLMTKTMMGPHLSVISDCYTMSIPHHS